MKYKLLASDLDGTFLNDRSEISAENKRAVEMAMEKGMCFALCSGRSHMSLKRFEEALGLNKKGNYGICYNGCIVYETDTHRILHETPLNKKTALYLLDELRRFNIDIVIYTKDALYAEKHSSYIDTYRDKSRVELNICDNFKSVDEDFEKILLIGGNDKLTQAYEGMRGATDGVCNMFFSSTSLLEFTDPNAHKGAGLEFLAGYLGIKQEETIAVGDNFNDITMLQWAGLGIAVNNAEDGVKNAANYITRGTNNENAVKEIIDTFILNKTGRV